MTKDRVNSESRRDALIRENEALRQALKAFKSQRRYTFAAAITKEIVKWGMLGLFGWLSVRELAGRVTVVDAAIDMCTSITDALKELVPSWAVQVVTLIVLGTAIVLVKRTRTTNKALVARAAQATRRLEQSNDPKRSSSRLGDDGDTHEDDAL